MDAEATRVGSSINMEKTKVTRINAKNQELIMIPGQGVAQVDEFTYLGATVFKEGGGVKDLKKQNLKANLKGKESEK